METLHFMFKFFRTYLNRVRRFIKYIPDLGINRYCPVCKMPSKGFAEFGFVSRENAKCMYCGALERHRLVWLYFKKKTDLFNGQPKKMLHVAPREILKHLLRKQLGKGYFTADLRNPRVMVNMDIIDISYLDGSFDVILCGHVLEHVPNDKQAMKEFFRVLKSDGWAILQVPITSDTTIEDPSVTTPSERLKIFGHGNHVRRYGPDFIERLREIGFKVEVTKPSDFLTRKEIIRMGLMNKMTGEIYYCTKK